MGERLAHVLRADVGDALQRKVHVHRVPRLDVVANALDDQLHEVRIQVDQDRYEEIALQENVRCVSFLLRTHNLLLGVLVRRQQVDRFHVSEVDVMAEQEDEEQLADVLLLLVSVQCLVS